MSGSERLRMDAVLRVQRKELSVVSAAKLVGVSVRQMHRIVSGYRRDGDAGLVTSCGIRRAITVWSPCRPSGSSSVTRNATATLAAEGLSSASCLPLREAGRIEAAAAEGSGLAVGRRRASGELPRSGAGDNSAAMPPLDRGDDSRKRILWRQLQENVRVGSPSPSPHARRMGCVSILHTSTTRSGPDRAR